MTELVIEATKRETFGKGPARRLRATDMIPANLLEKGKATSIQLNPKMLPKAWQAGRKFTLNFEGNSKEVFIKELQLDPVKRTALHVDLVYT